ncbi:MAG TPA: hypothetical protein VF274_04745 [Alphaproteobacteria bacterium]|jgi:hypothetical protein
MSCRLVALSLALTVLTACASEEEARYAAELCAFKERKDPVLIAYVDPRDETYVGEPDASVYKDETGLVASSLATPRHPVYEYEERRDCYNKEGDFYYPCVQKFEVDLSAVQGIGRALTLEKARALSVDLCQSKVDEIIIKKVGRPQISAATQCIVQHSQYCSLEGAPERGPNDKPPARLRWD